MPMPSILSWCPIPRSLPMLLTLALLGGWLIPLHAAELRPKSKLTVVDSTGKQVGEVLGIEAFGSVAIVSLTVLSLSFPLMVFGDRLEGNIGWPLFESTDCSGVPLSFYTPSPFPLAAVQAPGVGLVGDVVYREDPAAGLRQAIIRSQLRRATVGGPGVCDILGEMYEASVIPALPLLDLADHFTPPFRVR